MSCVIHLNCNIAGMSRLSHNRKCLGHSAGSYIKLEGIGVHELMRGALRLAEDLVACLLKKQRDPILENTLLVDLPPLGVYSTTRKSLPTSVNWRRIFPVVRSILIRRAALHWCKHPRLPHLSPRLIVPDASFSS
jgi:hypothetical protein